MRVVRPRCTRQRREKQCRMHIALVIKDLVGGGAERSVINLAAGLVGRGHTVDIVLFRRVSDYAIPEGVRVSVVEHGSDHSSSAEILTPPNRNGLPSEPSAWVRAASALNWHLSCLPSRRSLRNALAVASYITREGPDCILPNLRQATLASFLACRFLPEHPPLVPIVRGFVGYQGFRRKCRDRHMAATAAHFVAVSRGVAHNLAATLAVPDADITTIYNPVVTADLSLKIAAPPNHPWLSSDTATPVVLAAGRLSEQKDFPTLIKAFARIAARRTCRLIILGEGQKRKHLEDLIMGLGLGDRVSLPGWVENPFAFMARASLFVLSSRFEGLPGVLVQALACGCPSVSTDCPAGPGEILQGGRLGPLVPVGDHVALAKAMEQVLDRPPDRRVLQERGAEFSVENAVGAYENLIAKVIGSD